MLRHYNNNKITLYRGGSAYSTVTAQHRTDRKPSILTYDVTYNIDTLEDTFLLKFIYKRVLKVSMVSLPSYEEIKEK